MSMPAAMLIGVVLPALFPSAADGLSIDMAKLAVPPSKVKDPAAGRKRLKALRSGMTPPSSRTLPRRYSKTSVPRTSFGR